MVSWWSRTGPSDHPAVGRKSDTEVDTETPCAIHRFSRLRARFKKSVKLVNVIYNIFFENDKFKNDAVKNTCMQNLR